MPRKAKKLTFDKSDIINEHKHLTTMLNNTSKTLKKEYAKQIKELKQYRKK